MSGYFAIPLVVILAVMPFYLRAEYRFDRRTYLPLKLVCSLCFLTVGLISAALGRTGPVPAYDGLMIGGLVLSLIGDVLLAWSTERSFFILGLLSFLVAHVLYSTAFTLANGFSAWDLLLLAALLVGCFAAYKVLALDLGKLKIPVIAYLLVISFMLTKAVSSLYLGGIDAPARWLVVVGAVLFFISDGVLALIKFQRNPARADRAINLSTYYLGQILLALSLFFF